MTRYYIKPEEGTSSKKIKNLELDLAYAIGTSSVEINTDSANGAITVDIVNEKMNKLLLGDCISELKQNNYQIPLIIGRDLNGQVVVEDLARISNILVAGTTGTGKSNLLNTFIVDTIYSTKPEEAKMILIDTRIINFQRFQRIPNLIIPVITDPEKACRTMEWIWQECINRNVLFAKNNVKNIEEYNKIVELKLHRIIIFIEDLCDLMVCEKDDLEEVLIEIVKISRKVGIHLIISTYRTSTEIITGRIKANIPTRVTFKLPSRADSRTVINEVGAERLLPYGDALFVKVEEREPKRIQVPYISDEEIEKIIDEVKVEETSESSNDIMKVINKETVENEDIDYDEDILLNEAIDEVISSGIASTAFIQRRFNVGYTRAGRIIDKLEERGIISSYSIDKPREVLVNRDYCNTNTAQQTRPENTEEQANEENIRRRHKKKYERDIFKKWWFWLLVGIFLYVLFK